MLSISGAEHVFVVDNVVKLDTPGVLSVVLVSVCLGSFQLVCCRMPAVLFWHLSHQSPTFTFALFDVQLDEVFDLRVVPDEYQGTSVLGVQNTMWLSLPTPVVFSIQNFIWMIHQPEPWVLKIASPPVLPSLVRLLRFRRALNSPILVRIPAHHLILVHDHPMFAVASAELILIEYDMIELNAPWLLPIALDTILLRAF